MNIGLVVNARGQVCLVYDEPFILPARWVSYHVDKRQMELLFDNGTTYPIDWTAPDDMHSFLLQLTKILLIRMENKRPVEGWETTLLFMRNGRFVEDVSPVFDDVFYVNSLGQLVLSLGKTRHEQAPDRARLHAFTASLSLQWTAADEQHHIRISDAWLKKLIAATTIRVHSVHDDSAANPGGGFDVLLPLELDFSLTA